MVTETPLAVGSKTSLHMFIADQLTATNENVVIVAAIEEYCLGLPDQKAVFDFLRPGLGSRIADVRSSQERSTLHEASRDANGAGGAGDYRGVDGDPLPIPEPGILEMRWRARKKE